MKTANRLRAALVASLLGASVPAMAVNINFEDLTETGPIAGIGATYSAKGYTFTYAPNPPYMLDNVRVSPTSAGKVDNDED